MTTDLGIDHMIEAEFQRIMKEMEGTTLYGIPVDPSNVKQLVVAVDLKRLQWLNGPFQIYQKEEGGGSGR